LKTLSIKNPWAYLIAYGIKDVENRTWKTDFRGEFLIHVSGEDELDIFDNFLPKEILIEYDKYWKAKDQGQEYHTENIFAQKMFSLDEMTENDILKQKKIFYKSQRIIGKVEIIDCIRNSDSIWAEKNVFHWILKNPVVFENPIVDISGKLNFWNYDL
jgi:hypothetical protein